MREKIETYDESKVLEIVSQIKRTGWETIYKTVSKAIDQKLQEIFIATPAIAPVVEARLVTLRVKSLQMILESIEERMAGAYNEAIRSAGEEVGMSFGHDLINTLKRERVSPRNYESLLDTWISFDSSAGWGEMNIDCFDQEEKRMEISIQNNFLAEGYVKNRHRHCAFLEGYMWGVINEALFEWIRERIREELLPPTIRLTCSSVSETSKSGNRCVFTVQLGEEELVRSRDTLFDALQRYDERSLGETIGLCRTTLEYTLKEKVAFDLGEYISFNNLCKVFLEENVPLPGHEKAREAYFKASAISHGKKPSENEAYDIINATRKWLFELERLQIPDDKKKSIEQRMKSY